MYNCSALAAGHKLLVLLDIAEELSTELSAYVDQILVSGLKLEGDVGLELLEADGTELLRLGLVLLFAVGAVHHTVEVGAVLDTEEVANLVSHDLDSAIQDLIPVTLDWT